jgi:hypothetical protein
LRVSAYFLFILLTGLSGLWSSVAAQVEPSDSSRFSLDSLRQETAPEDTGSLSTDSAYATEVNSSEGPLKQEVIYTAQDSIITFPAGNSIELVNKAVVEYGDIKIEAGFIRIEFEKSELYAKGIRDSAGEVVQKPIFTERDKNYQADTMRYNFQTKKAFIHRVVTQEGEGFLHGEKVKKNPDNSFYIRNASFTTCNYEHPHFAIMTPKAKVIPGKKVVTQFAYLEMADIPTPLMVPFGFFPTTSKRQSGIVLPSYGSSQFRGYFLRNLGFYWAASDYFDVMLGGDIYTQGGFAVNSKINYKKRYAFNGGLDVRYSLLRYGREEFQPFVPNAFDDRSDFSITWRHAQDPKANPYFRFSGNVNIATSNFYKVNSVNANDVLQNRLNSSISIEKSWPGKPYNLSVSLNHNQNNQSQQLSLTLPRINFSVNRLFPFRNENTVGDGKWYEKINVSYTANAENRINTRLGKPVFTETVFRDSSQAGISHNIPISANYKLFNFIVFAPQVRYRERWHPSRTQYTFVDSLNRPRPVDTLQGFFTNRDFNASANFSTRLYGTFRYDGYLKALRHVLSPTISLNYRPDFGTNFWGFYQQFRDTLGEKVLADPFRGSLYGNAPTGRSGNVGFSLLNTLEAKVRDESDSSGLKKIKLLERLSLNTSYNMAADRFAWQPLRLTASSTALQGLINFNYSATFDPYGRDPETGERVNRSALEVNDQLFFLQRQNVTMNMRLDPSSFGGSQKKNDQEDQDNDQASRGVGVVSGNLDYYSIPNYVDFEVPWTLNLSYNLTSSSQGLNEDMQTSQSFNFDGNVDITDGWKVGFRSGYDFKAQEFTYTTFDFYRDLHCWQLSFNWVPFGFQQSYMLTIRVKANMLSDLKLERRRGVGDFQR